mmetsp:Transcript_18965/g.57586  ORF Transcript_18965/g.57586 Transcript_18965/m.57586 type:complete len:220 (-) Transcript_18965:774-1433(-)
MDRAGLRVLRSAREPLRPAAGQERSVRRPRGGQRRAPRAEGMPSSFGGGDGGRPPRRPRSHPLALRLRRRARGCKGVGRAGGGARAVGRRRRRPDRDRVVRGGWRRLRRRQSRAPDAGAAAEGRRRAALLRVRADARRRGGEGGCGARQRQRTSDRRAARSLRHRADDSPHGGAGARQRRRLRPGRRQGDMARALALRPPLPRRARDGRPPSRSRSSRA